MVTSTASVHTTVANTREAAEQQRVRSILITAVSLKSPFRDNVRSVRARTPSLVTFFLSLQLWRRPSFSGSLLCPAYLFLDSKVAPSIFFDWPPPLFSNSLPAATNRPSQPLQMMAHNRSKERIRNVNAVCWKPASKRSMATLMRLSPPPLFFQFVDF